jgi:hypothetical protein
MEKLIEAVLPLLPFLSHVLEYVPTLAVAAPLIAALIDGGKKLTLVKDGQAPLYSLALNALAVGVLAAFKLQEAQVADVFAALTQLAPALVALYLAIQASVKVHDSSANPFKKSYSDEQWEAEYEAMRAVKPSKAVEEIG